MKRIRPILLATGALLIVSLACGFPSDEETEATETASAEQTILFGAAQTSAVETAQAELVPPTLEATLEDTPTPTLTPTITLTPIVSPFLTANVNSNVRAGPGTVYDIHGYLLQGQTADIIGRNSNSSWWVIAFEAAPGGQGWIADSIVTVSGDTSNVPIVAAPPTPTPAPTGDWHGSWETTCGISSCAEMELVQNGDTVTGTYAAGEGSLSGTVEDNHLKGTWSRGIESGTFDFWLDASDVRFRGNWDRVEEWCGHRSGESNPSPCSVASWYGTWSTTCQNSVCGSMSLIQDGTLVEGTYAGGDGIISGTVDGTDITGTWNRNSLSGSIDFFMLSNGDQFNGNYNGSLYWCGHRNAAGDPGQCLSPP